MSKFIFRAVASSVFSSLISPSRKPTKVAAPVAAAAPKPVVQPKEAVGAGEVGKVEKERKASIRRGAVRRRVPKSVLGSAPSASKTLLGE